MIDWTFVTEHAEDDPAALRLKFLGNKSLSVEERSVIGHSIDQIECRRKYARKFPGWSATYPRFSFPSTLAGEQASHLWVAQTHAAIAASLPPAGSDSSATETPRYELLDMTAGLGIDFICMAKALSTHGKDCVAVEFNPEKADALRENLLVTGLSEAVVVNGDSMDYISGMPDNSIRLLFADPARRGEMNSRIYNPSDCIPDVVGRWENLLNKADWVMVKNSPLLDLRRALEIFPDTVRIVVTSVRNECKEVVVIARRNGIFEGVECINLLSSPSDQTTDSNPSQRIFIPSSLWHEDSSGTPIADADDLKEGAWIYEPNASLMKARPWAILCRNFGSLKKLSPNCNLFLSAEPHPVFPGRRLRIMSLPDGKAERKALKGARWNVATRNYPLRPEELARKLGVKYGGDGFIYGVTVGRDEKPVLLTALPA